jgi:hypothetical protein
MTSYEGKGSNIEGRQEVRKEIMKHKKGSSGTLNSKACEMPF